MGFKAESEPVQQSAQLPGGNFHTVRGQVGALHLWVLVSLIIVIIAVAFMVPQLRGQLFGAAVALYNSVAPATH